MAGACATPLSGVLVTGGASGIGRACATALAEIGRPVALWDLDGAGARKAADALASEHGVRTCAAGLDVRESAAFPGLIDAARAELGTIGGLVHSAGVSMPVPIDALDEQSWSAVLDVNLGAFAHLTRALLPDLRANPGSAIVGIASINAILGNGINPAYGASKAGLLGLTRSLADFLARDGVRANAVCPGYIDTPMLAQAFESSPRLQQSMERQAMLGRLAQPGEIGRVVRFLLSDDASYMTAEHVVVDGGAVRSQR